MNKRSALIGIIVLLLLQLGTLQPTVVKGQSSSQPPVTQWQKVYGEVETSYVSNLIQTSDGGYAFLDGGNTYGVSLFIPSTLYKLDSSGNMQWNKTINSFTAENLIQTSDGGYEIAGYWNTYGTTYQLNATFIKLDSKGNMQWYENTSTVLNLANVSSNIQTSDGGYAYFKPANATVFPTLTSFPALVKTDSNNDTQWIKNFTYSGPANYYNGSITFQFKIFSLIETSDGALAGLGIADPMLNGFGSHVFIYIIKTAPFLPLPSQSPLPTPLPSPTPTLPPTSTPSTSIPEFPSWAILPFLIAATTAALAYAKKKRCKQAFR